VQKTVAEHYAARIRDATNSAERSGACRTVAGFELASPDARRLVVEAVSAQVSDENRSRSAATDYARELPNWVYQAPGGRALLRRLETLAKTKHASRVISRIFKRS
jgi:hypothetical protein